MDKLYAIISQKAHLFKGKRWKAWEEVSKEMPGRSTAAIRIKFLHIEQIKRREAAQAASGSRLAKPFLAWSIEETRALAVGNMMYGRQWLKVAEFVGTRTSHQCYQRWAYLNQPLTGLTTPHNDWVRVRAMLQEAESRLDVSKDDKGEGRALSIFKAILQYQPTSGFREDAMKTLREDLLRRHQGMSMTDLDALGGRPLALTYTKAEDYLLARLFRVHGRRWCVTALFLNIVGKLQHGVEWQDRSSQSVSRRHLFLFGKKARLGLPAPNPAKSPTSEARAPGDQIPDEVPYYPVRKLGGPQKTKRRVWTAEEDALLRETVEDLLQKGKFTVWTEVARRMSSTGRNSWQCRNRWVDHIGTHLSHKPFTQEEDELLWPFLVASLKVPVHGRKFGHGYWINYDQGAGRHSKISSMWFRSCKMPGRSPSTLYYRMDRLRQTIGWLKVAAGVERPEDHVELIRRLTDSPAVFKITGKMR
ncbi:hypothetical protein GGF46_004294 [Coemansia sp. RSA 552]|nr:hypothetical protein GGF46_004294 [Coemansia sp. RSA 552]